MPKPLKANPVPLLSNLGRSEQICMLPITGGHATQSLLRSLRGARQSLVKAQDFELLKKRYHCDRSVQCKDPY